MIICCDLLQCKLSFGLATLLLLHVALQVVFVISICLFGSIQRLGDAPFLLRLLCRSCDSSGHNKYLGGILSLIFHRGLLLEQHQLLWVVVNIIQFPTVDLERLNRLEQGRLRSCRWQHHYLPINEAQRGVLFFPIMLMMVGKIFLVGHLVRARRWNLILGLRCFCLVRALRGVNHDLNTRRFLTVLLHLRYLHLI